MQVLSVDSRDIETQYKEFYTSIDSETLYKLSPISEIYYIPRKPVKGKHQSTCKHTASEMLKKYEHKPWTHKQITKAKDKVMKWNISKITLYIIEIRVRYGRSGMSSKFHYSPKYDEYLYEFCDSFLKFYYGEENTDGLILEVKRHIFNDESRFYEKIINYIEKQSELKWLRGIYSGTCSISKERFMSRKEYALA